jgi:hypothetical protein
VVLQFFQKEVKDVSLSVDQEVIEDLDLGRFANKGLNDFIEIAA